MGLLRSYTAVVICVHVRAYSLLHVDPAGSNTRRGLRCPAGDDLGCQPPGLGNIQGNWFKAEGLGLEPVRSGV